MPAPVKRGRFVWHELMSTDPDAAVRFYGKLIGWKTQPTPQDPSYRMWMVGDTPVGGLMRLPDEARRDGSPPFWVTYISVPDVDASVRQATSLGARTHVPPTDIPGYGRFAMLVDPQGAVFSVYASNNPEPDAPAFGGFTWHELATTDYKAAWEFYRKLFGWQKTSEMDMGPDAGVYFMFGLGDGRPLGGIYNKPMEVPMPNWLPYVSVRSADDVAAEMPRLGGRVLNAPMEVPGGDRVATGLDPQGAAFAVHWISATHDAGVEAIASRPKAKAKAKTKAKAKAKTKPKAKARAKPKKKTKARAKARPKARARR